jgi:hypothetical protein
VRTPRRLMLTVFTVVLVAVIPCSATTVYVSADDDNLYTIDPTTGATTLVGNMGAQMTDIALRNGSMFGTDYPASGPNSLYAIDPNTGAATLKGSTGVFLNALQFGSDGTLYGAGGAPGCGPAGHPTACNSLYTINTTTGAATLVGSGVYDSSGDLEFTNGLYLTSFDNASTDQLFKMDATTGAGTLVGDIGFADVFGLAYVPEAGTLYGFNDIGNNVISINTATGAGTSIANYSSRFEILGTATDAVPEPRSAGALMLGLGVLAGVLVRSRFRKRGLDTASWQ